ncbi:MAG: SpoIIE family protein phosphatase [Polyangia bacterium]|jgi:serine phosphatase RsbU (regulator of sigma subunit)/pSer/pThr/pTyr-binding forkhead associated (FHA) protein
MEFRHTIPEVTVSSIQGRAYRRIRLRLRTTVGRAEDNDIFFADSLLSRHHAEFQQRDGACYLVDLDSANGTFVNDVRVLAEQVLHEGDTITVGGISLVFHEAALADGAGEGPGDAVVKAEVVPEMTLRTKEAIDVTDLVGEDRLLGVLCQATNSLVVHHPLPDLFDKILEAILDAIPAERAAIMLLEGRPAQPTLKATRTRFGPDIAKVSDGIVQRALNDRVAFLLPDVFQDPGLRDRDSVRTDPIRSVMCAPLWSSSNRDGPGHVLGLVYLDTQSDEPPLTYRDLQILTVLANVTATKIESARLLEEDLHKRRLEEDMRLAAQIQCHLLPRRAPEIAGYSVDGMTEPCLMVGGDYFDLEHDGQHLYLALADVSGKGIGAAMLMVALQAAVRANWRDGSLSEATACINRTFHKTVPPDKYATFFLGRLDLGTGALSYVNAGQNRPLLIQPDGQWQSLDVGGTVLGAFAETTYQQGTVVLQPGACLLAFSDGISDSWSDADEADRQLVTIVQSRGNGTATALRAEIFDAVDRANGLKATDDRTLLIVQRLANSTS